MTLMKLGIERVRPLRGGYDEWKRLDFPWMRCNWPGRRSNPRARFKLEGRENLKGPLGRSLRDLGG